MTHPRVGPPTDPELPGDDEVLRALVHRRDRGVRGHGGWDDGHRVALVVGGGGMRGAYGGGMAHALCDAGLAEVFDVAYGSSAGAFIAAGVLLGEGRASAESYVHDMASRDFVDPRRLGTARPMVSLDHLFDEILTHARPMPWERLRTSQLRVVATALDDMTGHVLEPDTITEWRTAMRATAAIPMLAGPPVELHGRLWIDGSVGDPLPVLRALRDGSTHVLALLNRTVPELRRGDPGAGPARWARALDRLSPGLGAMAQESARHGPALAVLDDAGHPDREGVHLLALTPASDVGVRGLTIDRPRVRRATQAGYAAVVAALARVTGEGEAEAG